jgi:membrane-associated phospholipid phosphatase
LRPSAPSATATGGIVWVRFLERNAGSAAAGRLTFDAPAASETDSTPMRARVAALSVATLTVLSLAPCVPAQAAGKTATQTLGDIGEFALPATAVAFTLAHKDGQGLKEFALVVATTEAVVRTLKPVINRRRPNGGGKSFPSGHAASAFMGAAYLHRRYGLAYGLPAYAAATFVGYSRVHTKQHWTSDVVAGAAFGIAANLAFTRRFHHVQIAPVAGPNGAGVAMQIAW